jgi:RNA polymerase sigma-70 factor, ECF subfamily
VAGQVRQVSAVLHLERGDDFDRLYRRHAPSVYRYALAVLGNRADAEDVTQQTFLRAYSAVDRGSRPRKAENWLLTIAHNEVRRHFRVARGRQVEVELDERHGQDASEPIDPSLADVLRALQKLSPTHRSALVMREFEGRSYAEIAERMGMTRSALEATIFRARRSLAEELEGALTCPEAEEALQHRTERRLPHRIARRLKAHLHECAACVRHADLQKRQRAALRSLSAVPIPASLYLFRAEHAATALGGAATGVAGAGATGIGTGLAAKAAAVGAAVAVAGGVGYGVKVGPDVVNRHEPKVAQALVEPGAPERSSVTAIATPIAHVDRRAPSRIRAGSTPRKEKAKRRKPARLLLAAPGAPPDRAPHPERPTKPKKEKAATKIRLHEPSPKAHKAAQASKGPKTLSGASLKARPRVGNSRRMLERLPLDHRRSPKTKRRNNPVRIGR